MSQFPEALTVAGGRFQLTKLLRGRAIDGLWLANDRKLQRDVWVTLRRARHTQQRAAKLDFNAFGIAAPLYIGPPDLFSPGGEKVRDAHVCVVDEIPDGEELAVIGRLAPREGIQLGRDLCELVGTWAATSGGYVLRGLRPETIFLSIADHRFTCATPRPYFLLGNQNEFHAYPDISFDPPVPGRYEIELHDAVFTVALLIWWAVTASHPYMIPGTDTERNEWENKRITFDGPESLGNVLGRALVADSDKRCGLDDLRSDLERLLTV